MSLRRRVHGLQHRGEQRTPLFRNHVKWPHIESLLLLTPHSLSVFFLTMLPGWGSDIPDAGCELALSSLVGRVSGAVAGAPPLLLSVMFCPSSARPTPVQTHSAELPSLLTVAVHHRQTTLLLTDRGTRGHTEFIKEIYDPRSMTLHDYSCLPYHYQLFFYISNCAGKVKKNNPWYHDNTSTQTKTHFNPKSNTVTNQR